MIYALLFVRKARALLIGLTLMAPFLGPAPARSLEPEQREVIVINARAWEGYEYKETFLPSTKDEMTLISGGDSAIVYVRTLEYYWPLSRQVYVDFERKRDIVSGELVVRHEGEVVSRQPLQRYAILYPEGAVNGRGQLLWGEEAERAYARHLENERRFAQEFVAAQRAHAQYERSLVEAGAARQRGETVAPIEPPPPLPEPSLRLVTAPLPGFRVRLEPGVYDMALEANGRAVPGTGRVLRIVGLSGRAGLVADVVPEERWTRPLPTNTEAARIFARPDTVFYLTLAEAAHFEETEYLPAVDPQAEPVAGRDIWVRRKPAGADRLTVGWDSGETKPLFRQPLKVEQTRGSSFGYRVRPAGDDETPDLNAFPVQVPSDPAVTRGWIALTQHPEAAFNREVVIVRPRSASLGLALALLPLAGYLAMLGWRGGRRGRATSWR